MLAPRILTTEEPVPTTTTTLSIISLVPTVRVAHSSPRPTHAHAHRRISCSLLVFVAHHWYLCPAVSAFFFTDASCLVSRLQSRIVLSTSFTGLNSLLVRRATSLHEIVWFNLPIQVTRVYLAPPSVTAWGTRDYTYRTPTRDRYIMMVRRSSLGSLGQTKWSCPPRSHGARYPPLCARWPLAMSTCGWYVSNSVVDRAHERPPCIDGVPGMERAPTRWILRDPCSRWCT